MIFTENRQEDIEIYSFYWISSSMIANENMRARLMVCATCLMKSIKI
jgi:hypothetical protein